MKIFDKINVDKIKKAGVDAIDKIDKEKVEKIGDSAMETTKGVLATKSAKLIIGAVVVGAAVGFLLPVMTVEMGITAGFVIGCYNAITR